MPLGSEKVKLNENKNMTILPVYTAYTGGTEGSETS